MTHDPTFFRARLKQILIAKSLLHGDFTLASKESSNIYIDARPTTLDPEGLSLVSEIFFQEMTKYNGIEVVGCPWSVGAGPIVGCMVSKSSEKGKTLRGLMVRKERKTYGTGKIVEWEARLGSKVIMVEDIVNTGESVLTSIRLAEKEGAKVQAVFCLVDRGENTEKIFLENGYNFFSIFKIADFKPTESDLDT